MLESAVKKAVKKRLKALGAYHHWPVQRGMGEPCLDCHGCYQGLYFAIETKATGKKPTARQNMIIQKIRDADGEVFVIDSIEAAKNLFFDVM